MAVAAGAHASRREMAEAMIVRLWGAWVSRIDMDGDSPLGRQT